MSRGLRKHVRFNAIYDRGRYEIRRCAWKDRHVPENVNFELPDDITGRLKLNDDGLVSAVVQQFDTRDVLMVGWMDPEALRRTMAGGRVVFWSRSRQEYWRKGDTSGHVQHLKGISIDCDGDALLVEVDQVGAACHTGTRTCFTGRQIFGSQRSDVE